MPTTNASAGPSFRLGGGCLFPKIPKATIRIPPRATATPATATMSATIRSSFFIGGPSNALPLSGGRPSAADHPLQRLVGRLFNQESEPRATAIAVRVFPAPGVTAHLFFLPEPKVTPGSGLADSPSPNSCHLSISELHPKYQVRPTICRSAAKAEGDGR